MTIQEGLEKIKVLLAINEEGQQTEEIATEPATELAFDTYDLKDGSKIDLSAMEIGGDAMLVDATGNGAVAPDGEYELADGTMITVVAGKIEGVESPAGEMPTAEEIGTMAPMEAEKFDEMNATIGYLQAENEALKAKLNAIDGKFSQAFTEMIGLVQGLTTMPSADPIQKSKNSFRIVETKAEKVDRFFAKYVK